MACSCFQLIQSQLFDDWEIIMQNRYNFFGDDPLEGAMRGLYLGFGACLVKNFVEVAIYGESNSANLMLMLAGPAVGGLIGYMNQQVNQANVQTPTGENTPQVGGR